MKRDPHLSTTIALSLLLAILAYSSWRVVHREITLHDERDAAVVTIRFLHPIIHESGLRIIAELIADYERMNPGVQVEQVPVPNRIMPMWQRAHFVGGTIPDVVGMDGYFTDEMVSRYLRSLSDVVLQPNPHNRGTDLEGVPWRDTFLDGMASPPIFNPTLADIYGVPNAPATFRVFCNADLLREITGRDTPPATYDEFMALCTAVRERGQTSATTLVPMASSGMHAGFLMSRLAAAQTQTLVPVIDYRHALIHSERDWAIGYLKGRWTFRTPAMRSALELMHEVSCEMPAGFLQMGRDDAVFMFTQGHALMLVSGTWEADTLYRAAPFPIIVFPFPLPEPGHPHYGRYHIGPAIEIGQVLESMTSIAQASAHPEQAIDFLQYMTCRATEIRYTAATNRLGWLVNATVPAKIAAFAPRTTGEIDGFQIGFGRLGGRLAHGAYNRLRHLLMGDHGSVDAFTAALSGRLPALLRRDLADDDRRLQQSVQRMDGLVVVHSLLAASEAASHRKLDLILESQNRIATERAIGEQVLASAPVEN